MNEAELDLLKWLGQEDYSQYGECHGATLDALIAKGLAQLHGDNGELGSFIAKGRGPMYQSVSLTDAGRAALAKERAA
jgi:hypothetical protein